MSHQVGVVEIEVGELVERDAVHPVGDDLDPSTDDEVDEEGLVEEDGGDLLVQCVGRRRVRLRLGPGSCTTLVYSAERYLDVFFASLNG